MPSKALLNSKIKVLDSNGKTVLISEDYMMGEEINISSRLFPDGSSDFGKYDLSGRLVEGDFSFSDKKNITIVKGFPANADILADHIWTGSIPNESVFQDLGAQLTGNELKYICEIIFKGPGFEAPYFDDLALKLQEYYDANHLYSGIYREQEPHPSEPGRILEKQLHGRHRTYSLGRKLGSDAYTVVYYANSGNKTYAVKNFLNSPEKDWTESEIHDEVLILSKLKGRQAIIDIKDFIVDQDGNIYVITEIAENGSVDDKMRKFTIPEPKHGTKRKQG